MNAVPILTYHSVGDDVPGGFARFVVPPSRFRGHLCRLADGGYQTLTVSDLMQHRRTGAAGPTRGILLTFDDGFADFSRVVLPLLQEFGMTATLYVTTGLIGQRYHGLPILDWTALADIQRGGVEIGAHGVTHRPLDRLDAAAVAAEVTACKQAIEDRLGVGVNSFAYPFGFYTRSVRRAVIAAGYGSACAVRYGLSDAADDRFALRRLIVHRPATRIERAPIITPYHRLRSNVWALVRRGLSWIAE